MSAAPFATAALVAWLAVAVDASLGWRSYAGSLGLLALTGLLLWLGRRPRWRSGPGQVPASLAFLAAVALLRHSAGGIVSGVAIVSMLPVFYTALSSSGRIRLCVVLAGQAAFYLLPIVLIGPPPYPHSQYRAALLAVAVSSIVGLVTQRLVANVTFQATEAGRRERMLDQVGQLVRRLFESADPRQDLCEGPRRVSDAMSVVLLEPTDAGEMVVTAIAGFESSIAELPAGSRHPAHEALRSGRPRLVADRVAELAGPALWSVQAVPGSVLFQPLLKGGEPWGVLVVGWPAGVDAAGSRATVVALLAHEAAAAIDRADQISVLAGMAQTDPLTGLPNRRAWDARLAQAAFDGHLFAVAMLDLDHFKRFNDTHGHPAGDLLLKETAAAWRDQLRGGDLLARLGGEEFGLLLFDCGLDAAGDVTGRLRALVAGGQTCSVGLALRGAEESVEIALARADRALYDAKAAGRDRACASV
ncbi:MAG: diguanylate cyclase domain-containing protein [Solirubrobacteraceae bacterium]